MEDKDEFEYESIGGNPYYGEGYVQVQRKKKNFLASSLKVNNIINPSNEIEQTKISYEIKKLIDDYIEDVKTKEVNYNLYLCSNPNLIINYFKELKYLIQLKPVYTDLVIIQFFHKDYENFVELELLIDYLNFKCYLLNKRPSKYINEE
jgi:hypothetical protein